MSAPRSVLPPIKLFDLSGRVALITGATGALGGAAARGMAAAGARLTLAAGGSEDLEALGAELRESGAEVELVARRPNSSEDAEALVEAAIRAHGRIDILLTAAGLNKTAPIVDFPQEDWDAVMHGNVRATWLACRAVARRMLDQGDGGRVVLVSSTRGKLGHPAGYSAYCPSKAAIDGLTKTLACEWGPAGITLNAIAQTSSAPSSPPGCMPTKDRGRLYERRCSPAYRSAGWGSRTTSSGLSCSSLPRPRPS